ncbi:uncharacterized protein si:dkey-196h17.9 [Siniperca chuatsi]|uniref:uncharacterized protein si:dkey-196h17.9 n=1 Tax=Siniperca chuatsi TaxID=119488 RepID=UPI001CE06465|nr:uncharacterized protein si:dkey-196h17.9 [Siniperca chuatsi]
MRLWENPCSAFIRDHGAVDSQINTAPSSNVHYSKETVWRHNLYQTIPTEKLMMKKIWQFGGWGKLWRKASRRPLIENNNNDIQDGYDQACNEYDNPSAQNTFDNQEDQCLQSEQEITLQELAELLGVAPDANTSDHECCCSMRPEPNSTPQNLTPSVLCLMKRSVSQHFPKPPADLNQNLQQHLSDVQETVCNELVRLGPLLKSVGLMGCLIDCYHRQTFDHLNYLLQNISSFQNSFVLVKWVLHGYLSQELLGHPELQEMDPIKNVDLLLFTKCAENAKNKLLENVQKEVRGCLEKILQLERSQDGCDCEEAYVQLYVDIIQCIAAMPKEAQKISSKLSDLVREVCYQELLTFLRRYAAEVTEMLGNRAKKGKPETMHFFKTLKTCKELKHYIMTEGKDIERSLLQETVATLIYIEAFTLKLLIEVITDIAESHLGNYFRSKNKLFFFLIHRVKNHFPKLLCCQDVQKRVMDEVYKLITQIYLKHLLQTSQCRLRKYWSPNVGQTVAEDAKLLHYTMSDLAPGVRQWNLMLLNISELLECESTDTVKLIVVEMQKEGLVWSKKLELLSALLQWTGLSECQVREVLDAIPGHQPRSESWYSFLTCR